MDDTQCAMSPGSPIREIGGQSRIGKVIDHDENDLVLPYKVQFDGCAPDWVAASSIEPRKEEDLAGSADAAAAPTDPATSVEESVERSSDAQAVLPSAHSTAAEASAAGASHGVEDAGEQVSSANVESDTPAPESETLARGNIEAERPIVASQDTADNSASFTLSDSTHSQDEPSQVSRFSEGSTLMQDKVSRFSEGSTLVHDTVGIYRLALERLNDQLSDVPIINAVALRFRVPPLVVAAAGSCGIVMFVFFGFCGQLISTLLGVMYPAFESFKAVEAFSNIADPTEIYTKAAGMQFWLIYWVVAAVFASFEYMFYYVLTWIPFYYPSKLAVLLWLYLPSTRGANHIYHWVVAPTLRRNRHHIDEAIDHSTQQITQTVSGALTNVSSSALGAGKGGMKHLKRSLTGLGAEYGGKLMRTLSNISTNKDE